MFLLGMQGRDVTGFQFDGNRYSIAKTISVNEIEPDDLEVTHHYGLDEVYFQGIRAVALGRLTGWPYAWIHLRRIAIGLGQYVFNKRTLETRRRLDILRDVVKEAESGRNAVGALDLMSRRYGDRWAGHPDWKSHHDLLELHLELLAESGELAKSSSKFRPTGLALKTLDESEEQDRKHSANLRVQLLLALLTLVSSVMAAAQAGLLKLPTLLDLTPVSPKTAVLVQSPSAALQQAPVAGPVARAPATVQGNASAVNAGHPPVAKESVPPSIPARASSSTASSIRN